ncbi:DUF1028 domain-containing protein [Bosea lathyri]|jgi:uncharacterized Ntn-hydrolase superfamily protein|uniref:Uncharacterized conserved protein, Ntn-hydrolase superfamily n=1 Tax=Bosea lathyri TaxID=1036778 RepID=A0A1H5TTY7_9HYPH|nr:DUF1028 domain-containing protein [Bosea lathyri]SEF66254.1 Uncharacterized conserved protein, Ntn-hydrolase superfamily [Bosea lathyri]
MTWSIVARDAATGAFGVAVSTCAFAVGWRVPYGGGRIGAIATQALVNPLYGVDGLRLLQEGRSAVEIVATLTAADEGRGHRQLHVIDREGRIAAHTGSACIDWCGAVHGPQVSVAGNMLAGPQVVEDTLKAYIAASALDFDERLLVALEAGEKAGGDKRGRQSCAIRIWAGEPVPSFDIRVDDHADPLAELRRLWRLAHQRAVPFDRALPSRARPAGLTDRAELDKFCEDYASAWNARHPQG